MEIEGQLSSDERRLLTETILTTPQITTVLEVGTWLGGGSTVHILRALHENKRGHLWGIEADESIYKRMIDNLQAIVPEAIGRFTPLFGRSQRVIPGWLSKKGAMFKIDLVFLDGGNNPSEQITEFLLVDIYMPVGGILMTHDAKLRKGKWLVPYVSSLDKWESKLHDVSEEGLFFAKKNALTLLPAPVCAFLLKLLPERLSERISQGRK